MVSKEFQNFVNEKCREGLKNPTVESIDKILSVATQALEDFKDLPSALKITQFLKTNLCVKLTQSKDFNEMLLLSDFCRMKKVTLAEIEAFWRVMLFEARNQQLDSYFLYLEKNREPRERFYLPCRENFFRFELIQSLQGMINDDYDILCISMPPSTRKTTCEKFFNSGVIGWFPTDYNLFYSHSGDITRMYYDSVYQICTDSTEYTWSEIFPDLTVNQTNAKMQQFNVGKYKPFPSLQTASVGSEMAGKVRASRFLFVDDMIGKLEEALNPNILEKRWGSYSVDAKQRKDKNSDGKMCKEIILATRWSVHDVIGRIIRLSGNNPRVKIIAIPATYIDEKTKEEKSNFDYKYGGFTVEDFHQQMLFMDEISYKCLYLQQPIEREGLLYHDDELRRYVSLPLEEPEAVIGICDTKNTGTDYMFLPCFYKYGDDYYLVDCVCDNTVNFDVLYEKMVNIIVDNKMQMLEIESNQGGKPIATTLREKIGKLKWDCNITEKPTETNKEARIISNSHWVKHHILFKDKNMYTSRDEYGKMMDNLLSWTISGKNAHDDIPDCLANFRLFMTRSFETRRTVIRHSLI